MADIILKINLLDINIAVTIAKFLKAKPNNETKLKVGVTPRPDGEYSLDDYELAFATTRLWVEEVLTRHLWDIVSKGHTIQEVDSHSKIGNRNDYLTSG